MVKNLNISLHILSKALVAHRKPLQLGRSCDVFLTQEISQTEWSPVKIHLNSSERKGKKMTIGSHYRALGEDEKAEQEMFM